MDNNNNNIRKNSNLFIDNNNNAAAPQGVLSTTTDPLSDFLEVDINDLEFYERCGNGAFGCVYRARWVSRDKEVAVKKLLQLDNEANVLSKLSHRNIIRFYAAVAKTPNFCLITEYASKGSLQSFIASHKLYIEFGLDLILRWAKDIARGMNYLHEEAAFQIIHRDLKSTNVVISEDMVCKICDFGTSVFGYKTTKMSLIGTFPWMSPEIIQGQECNKKCDTWSYGVVLWELITGQVPFKGLESFQIAYLVVEKKQRLPIPTGCPTKLSELMQHCWNVDPKARPSFKAIIETLEQCHAIDMNSQFEIHKNDWGIEIQTVFERLKKIEQDLFKKEKILEERERKLHEQEITLINNFKIITIEDYDVNSWREIDVYEWVKKICRKNAIDIKLAEQFLIHNINGHSLLKLSKEDLKNIGITAYGHLIQLYGEIHTIKHENMRLLNFPPLKVKSCISSQISTKDVTFNSFLSAHIIKGANLEEHKWMMVIDFEDTEDNKDFNILLLIREVKFATNFPPFHEFKINKPPFKMPIWLKGIHSHSKVNCTIRYEDKVVKPKTTEMEFLLNAENNSSLMQEITVTVENVSSSEPTSATSTQSFSSSILTSQSSFQPNIIKDVWRNRTLENSINLPESIKQNQSHNFAAVVSGIYKPSGDNTSVNLNKPVTTITKSANASLINTRAHVNSTENPKKFQKYNSTPDSSKTEKRFNNNRISMTSDGSNSSMSYKHYKNAQSSPRADINDNTNNTLSTATNSNNNNNNANKTNNFNPRFNRPRSSNNNSNKQNYNNSNKKPPNREQKL